MSSVPRPDEPAAPRARVLVLIAARVRTRFALDAPAFADRLLDWARRAQTGGTQHDAIERLALDDLYLATACARGEEAAWNECLERHGSFVHGFARRFLREPAAGDVADQVIADLWERRKLERYEGRSTLRTWLGAIVAHAALNALKAGRRTSSLDGEERQVAGDPRAVSGVPRPTADGGLLLSGLVREALESLPDEDKLLVLLYYEQGLTLDEMAVALHASKATLSRKLKATRETLRRSIDALARQRVGSSAESVREGLDLGRLELDLSVILRAGEVKQERDGAV